MNNKHKLRVNYFHTYKNVYSSASSDIVEVIVGLTSSKN